MSPLSRGMGPEEMPPLGASQRSAMEAFASPGGSISPPTASSLVERLSRLAGTAMELRLLQRNISSQFEGPTPCADEKTDCLEPTIETMVILVQGVLNETRGGLERLQVLIGEVPR